jgi:hypothetical protein
MRHDLTTCLAEAGGTAEPEVAQLGGAACVRQWHQQPGCRQQRGAWPDVQAAGVPAEQGHRSKLIRQFARAPNPN